MRQLKITLDKYVEYHKPAPDYLLIRRLPIMYDNINGIAIPESITDAQGNFIGIGEILSINDFPSENDWINTRKEYLKTCKYVGFSFHLAGSISIAPQVEVIGNPKIVILHVKDISTDMPNLEELINEWRELNREEEEKEQAARATLQAERDKISQRL